MQYLNLLGVNWKLNKQTLTELFVTVSDIKERLLFPVSSVFTVIIFIYNIRMSYSHLKESYTSIVGRKLVSIEWKIIIEMKGMWKGILKITHDYHSAMIRDGLEICNFGNCCLDSHNYYLSITV